MSDQNQVQAMPLFYSRPIPLNADRHASAGMTVRRGYDFARDTNVVPVVADEFFLAQASYPIVFSGAEVPAALAVVGLATQRNLFVKPDGDWESHCYVPAYIRRYPFIPAQDQKSGELTLFIDEPAVEENVSAERRFFVEGEPTKATADSLGFCQAYHQQSLETEEFAKALMSEGLLVERAANIELNTKSGVKHERLDGFRVVDPAKFGAMSSEAFLEWRRRGWLPLVYAHLMSLNRWASIIDAAALAAD